MASQGDMECFIMEVVSYKFLSDKTKKKYKNTEMKIYVNNIINVGIPENKGVISKKISSIRCNQQIQTRTIANVKSY